MGLSYPESQRLGPHVAALHPDHPGNATAPVPSLPTASVVAAKKVPRTVKNALGQNKTEAAFDRHLADLKVLGKIEHYEWESVNLRLAGRTWLRLDFLVRLRGPRLVFLDVKGKEWEDDAAVKMKVAAEQHQWLATFWVVRRCGASWECRPVLPRTGLGRMVIGDPWLEDSTHVR